MQPNVASAIASEASDQENENRRILVRGVARAVRKCKQGDQRQQRSVQLVDIEERLAEDRLLNVPAGFDR